MNDGRSVGSQKLPLHNLTMPDSVMVFELRVIFTEPKHPAVREICNISILASIKHSFQDPHSSVKLRGIALNMGRGNTGSILFFGTVLKSAL